MRNNMEFKLIFTIICVGAEIGYYIKFSIKAQNELVNILKTMMRQQVLDTFHLKNGVKQKKIIPNSRAGKFQDRIHPPDTLRIDTFTLKCSTVKKSAWKNVRE